MIEAKLGDVEPSTSLKYYTRFLKPRRSVQIVRDLAEPMRIENIDIVPAVEELSRGN